MDERAAREPQITDVPSGADLRHASFPQAFKGYDREAVHAFLNRIADWIDTGGAGVLPGVPDVKRELERVGERTAGILTAAEEAAAKVRSEAGEYAASMREGAAEETRRAQIEAGRKAEELVAEAESKAERIVDEAIARRRRLNQAITSLLERRDEIAAEVQTLADDLLGAVDQLRAEQDEAVAGEIDPEPLGAEDGGAVDDESSDDPGSGRFAPELAGEPTELEPSDERETTVHRTS